MKVLLAVCLFICILYITLECANGLHHSRIIISTYPKNEKTPLKKSVHIINSRKFAKLKSNSTLENHKANYKKFLLNKKYTVFPPIAQETRHFLPESSEFPADRKRVKKVLPQDEYFLIRKKRSAATQGNNSTGVLKVAKKSKKVKRSRNKRKRIKRTGVNKNGRNSTLKKNKAKKKSKRTNVRVPSSLNKTKKGNRNVARSRKVKRSKKRAPRNLRYSKKPKNQSKLLLPDRGQIVPKKNQETKVIRQQEKKVMNRRLVAGRDAMIQDYPYVVSIQKGDKHWCAGALLNPRLVITTANCVWKSRRISRMRVRAGSRFMDRGGQLVKIQEVVKHPRWSIRSLPDNDVALLLLSKSIKFSDSVHGVDLPNRAMWPAFEDVWVTSWGAERRDGIFQSMGVTLQVYHAMLLDHEKCNNVTMRFGVTVSNNFICVAQTGRRAPCTRDTGAPAVSDGILWGVASWGIRKLCGTERYPAMFSYLASRSNLDFITNATNYLMSDKRYYPYGDRFVLEQAVTASTDATSNIL